MERELSSLKNYHLIRRIFAMFIAVAMIVTMTPQSLLGKFGVKTETEAAGGLSNPKIVKDSSMESGQKVTWDCIWFGEYPQTEIVDKAETSGCYGKEWATESDYEIDAALYTELQNASYDSNGDTTIGTTRYRRIQESDATYWTGGYSDSYNWTDSITYHYFRYDPIKWRVLNVSNGKALLLADKALDCQRYNTSYNYTYVSVSWETSTIRSWLNGYDSSYNAYGDYSSKNFIDSAFSSDEKNAIASTIVVNDDNLSYSTEGGNNTTDKIFFLSESEVYKTDTARSYGFVTDCDTYDEARRSKSSPFAKAMGTQNDTRTSYLSNCEWWLRSPGYDIDCASFVECKGVVADNNDAGFDCTGVRPALNLDLSYSDLYSYAGTVCSDGTVDENVSSDIGKDTDDETTDDKSYKITSVDLTKSKTIDKKGTQSIFATVSIKNISKTALSDDIVSEISDLLNIENSNTDVVDVKVSSVKMHPLFTVAEIICALQLTPKNDGDSTITATIDDFTASCNVSVDLPRLYGLSVCGIDNSTEGQASVNDYSLVYQALCENQLSDYVVDADNIHAYKYDIKENPSSSTELNSRIDQSLGKTISNKLPLATSNNDLFVFYYSGHATNTQGHGIPLEYTNTSDGEINFVWYNYKALAERLSQQTNGKIVVILDCCFAEDFITLGINKLPEKDKSRFTVLCAAESLMSAFSFSAGLFTTGLLWGIGYGNDKMYADTNNDGKITAEELSSYINSYVFIHSVTLQRPQFYLSDKNLVLFEYPDKKLSDQLLNPLLPSTLYEQQ